MTLPDGLSVLVDLFVRFGLMNLVAFGGITAMLPEIHRLAVTERHWMDDATFAHLFAIAQAAPGPNLLVIALIGWQVAGIAGALSATLGICLPMGLVVFFGFRHWERFRDAPWRRALQTGIAPLALGLVCTSAAMVAASAGLDWRGLLFTALCALAQRRFGWHPLWLIAAGALAGALGLI